MGSPMLMRLPHSKRATFYANPLARFAGPKQIIAVSVLRALAVAIRTKIGKRAFSRFVAQARRIKSEPRSRQCRRGKLSLNSHGVGPRRMFHAPILKQPSDKQATSGHKRTNSELRLASAFNKRSGAGQWPLKIPKICWPVKGRELRPH
jgi:hypothetical protein